MSSNADPSPATPDRSASAWPVYGRLALVSFLILFLELACIRWFSAFVIFLTFFTNIVLLACVLGMSVGCLTASGRRDYIVGLIPLALVAVGLSIWTLSGYQAGRSFDVSLGDQRSPQMIYFGTESLGGDSGGMPIEVVAGGFFVLIALMFVGPGQELGRAFAEAPDRIKAYTANIGGSLAGIAAFGLASWLEATPLAWFGVGFAAALPLLRRWVVPQMIGVVAILIVAGTASYEGSGVDGRAFLSWSPYYKVAYNQKSGVITTNNIGHQTLGKVGRAGSGYGLPYLLNRDAGGPPIGDVLVVGAGSGNDVAAAIAHGAKHVDAVELDPVIARIGARDHPDRPFSNPAVSLHLDDGRSFVRRTERRYDLAVYALVDSLVLHSGYSSLRLESFLFTEQAFRDVKAKLKPNGAFVMYNYYRQGWVVGRLARLAKDVFGADPIILTIPPRASIKSTDSHFGFTVLIAGDPNSATVKAIRRAFADRGGSYWTSDLDDPAVNGFGAKAPEVAPGTGPEPSWGRVAPTVVDTSGVDLVPTDDWPFLYLREPAIPALNVRGLALIAGLSMAILLAFAPARSLAADGRMFFLGAGFMLLETKGVVHMALLFGSTWIVNSIVFFAILVMVLLSNLYVLALRPRSLAPFYALLFGSLLVNILVPMETFLALPGLAKVAASCAVISAPVFFAGVIFAVGFRRSARPDLAIGSNVAGVVLGGLSEYLSLVLGFTNLLWVAVAFYLLAWIIGPARSGAKGVASGPTTS